MTRSSIFIPLWLAVNTLAVGFAGAMFHYPFGFALGAWLPLRDPALGVFAAAHLLNGLLLALLPIRNYDGEIIWREARRLLRERPSATP